MSHPKVFCVGFQKTGTTSLGMALETLGYEVCGYVSTAGEHFDRDIRRIALGSVDVFDAFEDNPWPLLYRQLDARCPGSRFILTLRPERSWIASVVKHFGRDPSDMQRWIYGHACPVGHEQVYLDRYRQHNSGVLTYFKHRPADLLVLRLTEGQGWRELCGFLNCPIPDQAFPCLNRAQDRPTTPRLVRFTHRLRRLTGLPDAARSRKQAA